MVAYLKTNTRRHPWRVVCILLSLALFVTAGVLFHGLPSDAAISADSQNKLGIALTSQNASAEVCDAIDANTTLLSATAGTGTASKALILNSSGNATWPNSGALTAATVGGSNLGSTAGEWGFVYTADSKGVYFGTDQDANLLHNGTTGLTFTVKTNDAVALHIKDNAGTAVNFFTIDTTTATPLVKVLQNLSVANTMNILPATAGGSTLGSTSAEWGSAYVGDSKGLYWGADQDASLLHNGTTGVSLTVKTNDATAFHVKDDAGTAVNFLTIDTTTATPLVKILQNLSIANTMDILPATAKGSDIGSTTLEWGDIFVGDAKYVQFGDSQDGFIGHSGANGLTFGLATGALALNSTAISGFAAAADATGTAAYIETQDGGVDTAADGGSAGGLFNFKTGDGSAGGTGQAGGPGGGVAFVTGAGAAGEGAGDGGAGGAFTITTGAGAADGGTGTDGNGGAFTVTCGQAGGAGGTGGSVSIDAGAANNGTAGSITIGGTNAAGLSLGRSGTSVTIAGNLSMTDTMDILPATAKGSDIGSASAEWGDIFVGTAKSVKFGDGQESTIQFNGTHLAIDGKVRIDRRTFSEIYDDFAYVAGSALQPIWAIDEETANTTSDYVNGEFCGAYQLAFSVNDEAQAIQLTNGGNLLIDTDKDPIVEFRLRVDNGGINAVEKIYFGVVPAHANAEDSMDDIDHSCVFKLNGAATWTDIVCESDDGVNDVSQDSTINLVDDTYTRFRIDMSNLADVKMYVDDVEQGGATTHDMTASANQALQVIVVLQRANNTGTEAITPVEIDYIQITQER